MYVQDLNVICEPLTKKQKQLNMMRLTFIVFLSVVSFLFSIYANATEKNLFSPSASLQLDSKKPINTQLLHSYLEKNTTGVTPTYAEATTSPSSFWTPITEKSKAIAGNSKAHWFRLLINNSSNQQQHYVFSIAPTRSNYIKAQVLPFFNNVLDHASLKTASLQVNEVYNQNIEQAKRIDINLILAGHESKVLIFNMASDIWTIPHFDLQTKDQLTRKEKKENHHWQLINGIFICMIFFILSAAIITKQSGLLWLPMYSISTVCFIPNYLIYNFEIFGLNASLINTVNIDISIISLIAFIGILKYIFYDNAILQKISHFKLIFMLVILIAVTTFIPKKNIGQLIYAFLFMEISACMILSILALRHKHPIAACLVGPIKIIVFSLILIAIFYAKLSVISQLTFHISLASIILLDTAILTIILLLIDRHRREEALYKLVLAAKKEQQVATISPLLGKDRHDLRASLSDIIGLSELIIASPLDQEQRKNILDLQQSGRKGLEKINQIFSYKNNNNDLLHNQEPFTLSLLLSECAQYYGYRADELKKEVIIDIAENTPEYWKGDHEKIRQLFMHLFEYYLSTGEFYEVRIDVSSVNGSSIDIAFSMSAYDDDFDSKATIKNKTSTARIIAKKLGGSLSFTIKNHSLLMETTIQATLTTNQSPQKLDLDLLRNRRIIIIDDSETSCNVIESYLKRWQVSTFKANNFNDAIAIIKHQKNINQAIDLALIDYIMPDINGIEVSKRLRYDDRYDVDAANDLSIIIMSNAASSIKPSDIKNYGIKQVLDKPVLAHTLRLVLLEEFYFLRSLQTESTIKENAPDIKNKQLLLVEDNPVSAKIICSMLKKLKVDYTLTTNSHDAIKAVMSQQFDFILMDCELPDESGFTTTRKIRAYEKNQAQHRTPAMIIALTAYDNDASRQESMNAGMDDYLSKPINLTQLSAVVTKAIKH